MSFPVRPVTGFALKGALGARPPTNVSGGTTLGKMNVQVSDGNLTATIYGHIRDHEYSEAIALLSVQLEEFPRSRAALSLLGYCYYQLADYAGASASYEQLTRLYPTVEEYTVYYAQSLYKAGLYAEANKMASLIDSEQYQMRLMKLQGLIAYEQDELQQTKACLNQCVDDTTDMIALQGCILYKDELYEEALKCFEEAITLTGFRPHLAYNVALCYYKLEQYSSAFSHITNIIEKGIQDSPELNIGGSKEYYGTNEEATGSEIHSVGNSALLRESALIEVFNLKIAIEYMMKNPEGAREALRDMPPRLQEELDPVTLHNTAIINMEEDPSNGFKKLNYLLQNPPFPPETFQNVLLFYCQYQYYDLAADILAENPHLSWKYLSNSKQPLYDFLDGLITAQTAPAEAYQKFEILAQKHIEQLRKLAKKAREARDEGDTQAIKQYLKTYGEALENYIPVLMAQGKIYWDLENYPMVEKLFRQSAEFCSEHEVWKLNVAHVFFMQETKFRDAIRYYEPVVEAAGENILNCSAIILANLCVSYIMTSMNDRAEEIMRRIEREEEKLLYSESEKQPLHLCITNLVIGTLYCSKGNYEFGISRVIKSLEPYHRKIMTDTWFYAKRCCLALAMSMAKQMTTIRDVSLTELLDFFDHADQYGEKIPAVINPDPSRQDNSAQNTIRYEARQLKSLFLRLRSV